MAIADTSKYIKSNKIEVFPSGYRATEYAVSKLNTEHNLSFSGNLSKNSINNSFFIEDPLEANHYLIGISGYVFRFHKSDLPNKNYAYLRLENVSTKSPKDVLEITGICYVLSSTTSTEAYAQLDESASDGESYFVGLAFDDAKPSTKHCVQVRASGTVKFQPMRLSSDELRDAATGNPLSECITTNQLSADEIDSASIRNSGEIETQTINGLVAYALEDSWLIGNAHKDSNALRLSADATIDDDVTITAPVVIEKSMSVQGIVTISDEMTIEGPLYVYHKSKLGSTGDVVIDSAGEGGSTFVGPNNGTITLPADITGNNKFKFLFQKTSGTGAMTTDWATATSDAENDTLVYRDSQGKASLKNLAITGIKGSKELALKIDANGNIASNDLTTASPTTQLTSIEFIDTITQNAIGKISATKKIVPVATNDSLGLVKSKTTGDVAGRFYDVEVNSDGTMTVNVPWENTRYSNATTSAAGLMSAADKSKLNGIEANANNYSLPTATATTLGGVKLGYTTNPATREYAVSISNGNLFVTVPWSDTDTHYTISTGTNQGELKENNTTVKVKGLSTTDSPTFTALSLTNNRVRLTSDGITTLGDITASGNIMGNSFFATSDMRLKKNLVKFEYKKSILDLPIYRFDFIDGAKNNIGCMAQDLQKMYPELVNESDDGHLSIQETKLVYLLIEEVRKLREELNALTGGK